MSALVAYADTNTFKKEVLEAQEPVLVDFWAEWCGPCRMLGPTMDKLADAYQGKAKIVKINTDDSPEVAEQYHISAIPTVMLFVKGAKVEEFVGVQPFERYAAALDNNL